MQTKNWILRDKNYTKDEVERISRELCIPPVVVMILLARGVKDIKKFVCADTSELYDPFLMLGMKKAVERILSAIRNKEKITIYGDYDVDGITSTVVLVKFLKSHGAIVDYYIPDRLEEGYGINISAIDTIAENETQLLITVDCGITAVSEIAYAKEKGVEVIVTDHHECQESIPEPYCILNPKQPDCPYPFKKLAGVGVVFKLIQALTTKLRFHMGELLDEYIDLVAIGTVADVMPIEDENRIIVKSGIEHLLYTSNHGIKALIRKADICSKVITASTIGFLIAPRINAAGRMGDPKCAVELLLAEEEAEAEEYAQRLENENKLRQSIETEIFNEVTDIINADKTMNDDCVIVVEHENWHHGIIGIVASKISERYNKPCILISIDEVGNGKGSGRSIKAFNLFEALTVCSDNLQKFGGHELAAGLNVEGGKTEVFRKTINEYAKSVLKEDDFIPQIFIDTEIPIDYLNINTAEKLGILQPYGMGNPSPVFYTANLTILSMRTLSDGRHLRMMLSKDDMYIDSIGFNMGKKMQMLRQGDKIDIVYNLDINLYRGEKQAQIHLRDLRFSKGN